RRRHDGNYGYSRDELRRHCTEDDHRSLRSERDTSRSRFGSEPGSSPIRRATCRIRGKMRDLMRSFAILLVWSFASAVLTLGQSIPAGEVHSPIPIPIYHLLREEDDLSFLADPAQRQDSWDPIKFIPLRQERHDWFLSMGGEARYIWEQIGNDNWGQQPFMNSYFNQRYMFYFDVHYGKHVRSFVELKSGLNSYRIGGPRPIDEKKLDFQAAFLEVGTGGDRNWIKFRAGRHEMEYGFGRLIDVREGPNVRLSFDGFKVKTNIGSWQIDGFAMRPDL